MLVLENGWSDTGDIDDRNRIKYFREHLQEILDAIQHDECNVQGYSGLEMRRKLTRTNTVIIFFFEEYVSHYFSVVTYR